MTGTYVTCYGIAGRDRKVKFHSKELGDNLDDGTATTLALAWLATMKQVSRPRLDFVKVSIDGPLRCVTLPAFKSVSLEGLANVV